MLRGPQLRAKIEKELESLKFTGESAADQKMAEAWINKSNQIQGLSAKANRRVSGPEIWDETHGKPGCWVEQAILDPFTVHVNWELTVDLRTKEITNYQMPPVFTPRVIPTTTLTSKQVEEAARKATQSPTPGESWAGRPYPFGRSTSYETFPSAKEAKKRVQEESVDNTWAGRPLPFGRSS